MNANNRSFILLIQLATLAAAGRFDELNRLVFAMYGLHQKDDLTLLKIDQFSHTIQAMVAENRPLSSDEWRFLLGDDADVAETLSTKPKKPPRDELSTKTEPPFESTDDACDIDNVLLEIASSTAPGHRGEKADENIHDSASTEGI